MVANIISPDRYSLVPFCLLSGSIRIGCQAAIDPESGVFVDRVEFTLTPSSGPTVTQIAFDRTYQVPGLYDGGIDGLRRLESVLDYNVQFDLNAVADGPATIVATIYSDGAIAPKTLAAYNFTNNSGGTITPSTWYVSQSGNDSTGTGSITAPFLTAGKAVSVAAPGDTILIGKGDGSPRNWMDEAWATGSGASSAADIWITFDAYDDTGTGEGAATIEWRVDHGVIPRSNTGGTHPNGHGPRGHDCWRFGPGIKFYEFRASAIAISRWWFDGCEWYTRGRALGVFSSSITSPGALKFDAAGQYFETYRPNSVGATLEIDHTVLEPIHVFEAGDKIDISGTTLNNGTFTVNEQDGSKVYVDEAIADEWDHSCTALMTAYQLFGVDTARVLNSEIYLTGTHIHHFSEWNSSIRLGRGCTFHDFASDSPLKSSSTGGCLWYNTRIYRALQGQGAHGDFLQTNEPSGGAPVGSNGSIWYQGIRALDSVHALMQTSNQSTAVDGIVIENVVHVNDNSGHYTQTAAYGPVYTNNNWANACTNIIISNCTFINQPFRLNPIGWENARIYNCIFPLLRSFGQGQTELAAADISFWGCVMENLTDFTSPTGGGFTGNRVGATNRPSFVRDSFALDRDERDFTLVRGSPGYNFVFPIQLTPPGVADSGAWASAATNNWQIQDLAAIPRVGGGFAGPGTSARTGSRLPPRRRPGAARTR